MSNDLIKNFFASKGLMVFKADGSGLADFIQAQRPIMTGKELIRIGGAGDGGYLVPDVLEGIEYCFSPGVDQIATFECDLERRGIKSFLADYSVDGPPVASDAFVFDKKFLGVTDSERDITLKSWVEQYLPDHDKDLILQMDIEGSEYPVIVNTPVEILKKFRIMVIEFHSFDKLLDTLGFRLINATFEILLEHFHVAHIHPNNRRACLRSGSFEIPRNVEYTFIRKDRVQELKYATRFTHPLDSDSAPGFKSLVLPKCWYS